MSFYLFICLYRDIQVTSAALLQASGGGGLMASGRADEIRVLSSNPGTGWPLFFGNTAE